MILQNNCKIRWKEHTTQACNLYNTYGWEIRCESDDQFGTAYSAANFALRSLRNILPEGDLGIASMKNTRLILL
jgi:hypothetical protein